MNFIRDNQERIVLLLIVLGMFGMAASVGIGYRGGKEWRYTKTVQHYLHPTGTAVEAATK